MSDLVAVLDRQVYSEAEAARLLAVPQGTLHYWLEGGSRRNVNYKPIIRPEATGLRSVTWGEFIEAGLLSEYRKRSVPMRELRSFILDLRDGMGIPYPLAHERPWLASGTGLVLEAQQRSDLPKQFWLWSGQGMLTFAGQSFVERVDWGDDIALAYRPHTDPESPVRVDPRVRFGRPSIGGISTQAIYDESEAGFSVEELAGIYGLSPGEIRWALAYESTKAA